MYSFIKELNEYSVGRDYKQFKLRKALFEEKFNYLKFLKNKNMEMIKNPTEFNHLRLDSDLLEEAEDVSEEYPVSLSDEKELIMKRTANLEYLRKMNHTFEYCRTRCKIQDSRARNINFLPSENQQCLTDCLNIRTENNRIKKPGNDEKVFIWLA